MHVSVLALSIVSSLSVSLSVVYADVNLLKFELSLFLLLGHIMNFCVNKCVLERVMAIYAHLRSVGFEILWDISFL